VHMTAHPIHVFLFLTKINYCNIATLYAYSIARSSTDIE